MLMFTNLLDFTCTFSIFLFFFLLSLVVCSSVLFYVYIHHCHFMVFHRPVGRHQYVPCTIVALLTDIPLMERIHWFSLPISYYGLFLCHMNHVVKYDVQVLFPSDCHENILLYFLQSFPVMGVQYFLNSHSYVKVNLKKCKVILFYIKRRNIWSFKA